MLLLKVTYKVTPDFTPMSSLYITYGVFGLRNEMVHHLLIPDFFFVWFVEWNRLMHRHLILP
jgi:hypothetical protein